MSSLAVVSTLWTSAVEGEVLMPAGRFARRRTPNTNGRRLAGTALWLPSPVGMVRIEVFA